MLIFNGTTVVPPKDPLLSFFPGLELLDFLANDGSSAAWVVFVVWAKSRSASV